MILLHNATISWEPLNPTEPRPQGADDLRAYDVPPVRRNPFVVRLLHVSLAETLMSRRLRCKKKWSGVHFVWSTGLLTRIDLGNER